MDIRQTRLAVALLVPLALTTCTKDARVRTQAPAASARPAMQARPRLMR